MKYCIINIDKSTVVVYSYDLVTIKAELNRIIKYSPDTHFKIAKVMG